MSEVKDPTIKLFGKTIDVVGEESLNQDPSCCCSSDSILGDSHLDMDTEELESEKSLPGPKQDDAKKEDLASDELIDSNSTPPVVEESKTLSADSDAGPSQTSKTEEDQNETSNPNEKTLKKPDKILPCPRCSSMDTKFCYFNNYNVNQPRHFCKNCQRYWTAGGSMRNVPVGAGRRKTKTAASLFHHLAVPEALQNQDLPNGVHHPNGTVLTFSSDAPFCESMVSVLNIADKNGFQKPGELAIPVCLKENGEDQSCGSTVGATSSKDESGKNMLLDQVPNHHQFPPQIPVFPGAPWPYPWNSVRWSSPLSPPNFGPPGFPLPFYSSPPPYWGCSVPGSWNMPWVLPQTASQSHTPPSSGPNSTTLGKHSRDDSILKPDNEVEDTRKQSNPEKCLWHPKTLRIDDPEEAAKSSIWSTLGIKNDRVDSVGKNGLFKAFQSQLKEDKKAHLPKPPTALQANPAALSRSLIFHESS